MQKTKAAGPGPESPSEPFECVVSVSKNGRRFSAETRGAIIFLESGAVISSRTVGYVLKDLFFRLSDREPKLRERLRFAYDDIAGVYFTGKRSVRIELRDGRAARLIFTFLARSRFIELLDGHGIAFGSPGE